MAEDPEKLCNKCNHGADYCITQCDYYLITTLRKKYPEETEVLYKKIRKDTIKMIKEQKDDDEDIGDFDDGED